MSYRAAIVGCGLIGSEFSDTASLPGVWSHAQAYTLCDGTDLVAVCDPDAGKLAACGQRWGVAARYSDFSRMLDEARPDIVSICAPDASHHALIREALLHPSVRAVLAEKPLALELAQADELVDLAAARGVVLAVNYTRRYAAGFEQVREWIAAGALGGIQTVSGYFTKGTLHNGSHWFDLAEFLVGPVIGISAMDRLREGGVDPTLDVLLRFESGASGFLHGCDSRAFALFEMDVIGSAGRLRIVDSGFSIELHQVEPSPFGGGYRRLACRETIAGGLPQALLLAVEDVVGCIANGAMPRCSGGDAARALKIGLAAHRSAQTGQPVELPGFF